MLPLLPDPHPYFDDLPDPCRETRNTLHKLYNIVMIVLCAVLSGVKDWVGIGGRVGCGQFTMTFDRFDRE